ncbi:MAG: hypothetical protein R2728_00790 [Chitinophagales bacterium]
MIYYKPPKDWATTISRDHILIPNIVGPLMVIMTNFAAAILIEAGLSFIGIGVQPPKPSLEYVK